MMTTKRNIEPVYRRIAKRIAAHREAKGITRDRLGFMIGQTRANIYHIETGAQRTQLHVLLAISKALDVDLEELLD